MNEYQIREGLRKHWDWLKDTDYNTVASFVIGIGNRKQNKWLIDK